jgi:DNA polymerase delta subunit 2
MCTDTDEFFLEDRTLRVKLLLPEHLGARLATGLVVAVRGHATLRGEFRVADVCLANMPPAVPVVRPPSIEKEPAFLAFASGLAIGASSENLEARSEAINFISGQSQQPERKCLSSAVQHLVLCGGTFPKESVLRETGVKEVDSVLAKFAFAVPTDIMPGRCEPTNLSLPQRPLHSALFKEARKAENFRPVGNPHTFNMGSVHVTGHAGQPVDDLMRCTKLSPLEALTTCLEALHLAPTAPDTLETKPFKGEDPFIIEDFPHILFLEVMTGKLTSGDLRPMVKWAPSVCACQRFIVIQPSCSSI